MLAAYEEPDDLLSDSDKAGPAAASEVSNTTILGTVTEQTGDRIGPYKLREKIGEGGCGVVYVAEQEKPVRRRVALKVIKLGMDTRSVIARFEAERQALAMMDHPNIAKVLDAGATEAGRPYFVMELVRGIRLTDYCDQHNLSTKDRLDLFMKVCHAIQHAHQKGIIHRDIKPSNILVTLHDGVPVPKVIDFGIAKATEGRLSDLTVYTEMHQFLGTPAYMSPEQAEMSGLDIDTRSDIYALGVLPYELLTGHTPFDAKELLQSGLDEIRRTIRDVEPPRPSTRLSTMVNSDLTLVARRHGAEPSKFSRLVRGDLDWIVMKCLEKDRTRRYDTANGLAADLKRHLNNETIVARPPSAAYRFQKMVRRNKFAFAAAAAVLVALLLGLLASTWQAVRATHAEKKIADTLKQVSAERDAKELARQEAEAISRFLTEVFESPDPTRNGRIITVAEMLDKAAKKLETDPAIQPERRAKLQATLGGTYFALGLYREAFQLQEKVRDYNVVTFGQEQPATLLAIRNLAQSYLFVGRWGDAIKLSEEVFPRFRKVFGPEHEETLVAMGILLRCYNDYRNPRRLEQAPRLQEELLPLYRKVLGPEHPRTLNAMENLALSAVRSGRSDEAVKILEQVQAIRRKVLGPEHPDTLSGMNSLAIYYGSANRRDEALKLREEALALSRKVLGPEHPTTLNAMCILSGSYLSAGRSDDALKLSEEALTLSRKALPEHPLTISALNNLSAVYAGADRSDEALKLSEEALQLSRKVYGPEHPGTLNAMANLAGSYFDANRRAEALKLREEALPLFRKVLGPEHRDTVDAMLSLSVSYHYLNRPDEALKLREEGLLLAREVLRPDDPVTIDAREQLAESYSDANRSEEALTLREEGLPLSRKVHGPEHPDTLNAALNLSGSYFDVGRKDETLKLCEEVLPLYRKVLGSEHPTTLVAIGNLAECYADAGRGDEALRLHEELASRKPDDTAVMMRLAAYQLWFGRSADHANTVRRIIAWAKNATKPDDLERVAKIVCLCNTNDTPTREAALVLAHKALDLGRENRAAVPWYQMTLGMAEYRNGYFAEATKALTAAEAAAADLDNKQQRAQIRGTAGFYRAMSLFRQGLAAEARTIFNATEERYSAEKTKAGANQDDFILWLARKEARTLLQLPGAATTQPSP